MYISEIKIAFLRMSGAMVGSAIAWRPQATARAVRHRRPAQGLVICTIIMFGLWSSEAAQGGDVWDIATDFSATNNPNGVWSYGSTPTLGGTFTALTNNNPLEPGVSQWYAVTNGFGPNVLLNGNSTPVTYDGTLAMNPGQFLMSPGTPDYVVARWTAPSAGAYQIDALFEGMQYVVGDTVDVHVLDNNTSIFDGDVIGWAGSSYISTPAFGPSPEQAYNTTVNLTQGATVDFVIGDGGNGQSYDSTGLSVVISSVPEPSTMVLLGLATVLIATADAWRRRPTASGRDLTPGQLARASTCGSE